MTDSPAAGTYPTLDAAEHGQPLASLERLVDLILFPGQVEDMPRPALKVLVADHANAVRARIAELEAQLATSEDRAAGWDGAAAIAQERIAELEAELARERASVRVLIDQRDDLDRSYGEACTELAQVTAEREQSRTAYAELRHAHAELEDRAGHLAARVQNLESQMRALGYGNA